MKIFDLYVEPFSCATIDLESLAYFGTSRALLGAGYLKTRDPQLWIRHFARLQREERARVTALGIAAQVTLGLSHEAFPLRGVRAVWVALRELLRAPGVAAVGPLSLGARSAPEQAGFVEQLALAAECGRPALVALPARGKLAATEAALTAASTAGLSAGRVVLLHADWRVLVRARAAGCWAALSVHPEQLSAEAVGRQLPRYGAERAMFASCVGVGSADFLSLPRAALRASREGVPASLLQRAMFENAAALFGDALAPSAQS